MKKKKWRILPISSICGAPNGER